MNGGRVVTTVVRDFAGDLLEGRLSTSTTLDTTLGASTTLGTTLGTFYNSRYKQASPSVLGVRKHKQVHHTGVCKQCIVD
ncbi:hypothetical protein CDAR_425631 [Caerostris darwini]|uniref:Uncharacterized protein n=1 Tax=Caerostris darwini TaxID=1538125 RepID=A0AAV4N398_9ARAC|nr:hypothetical protein CDAR_425631 [Caerostris darwini]